MKKTYVIIGIVFLVFIAGALSQVFSNRDQARTEYDARGNAFTLGAIQIDYINSYIDDDGIDKVTYRYYTNYTHNSEFYEIESRIIVLDTLTRNEIETLITNTANEFIREEIDSRPIIYEDVSRTTTTTTQRIIDIGR